MVAPAVTAAFRALLAGALALAAAAPAAPAQDGSTKVYLSREGALRHVFPGATHAVELKHLLGAEETAAVEALTGRRLEEGGFFLYAAQPRAAAGAAPGAAAGEPTGEASAGQEAYAVIVAEIGKVRPITHMVGVSAAGEAGRVAVMIYRESHGADVAGERFMAQYAGKTLADPIRVDKDIINVAGSTLSAHAICRGVRKALAVVQVVLLGRDTAARAALLAGGTTLSLGEAPGDLPNTPSGSARAAPDSAREATPGSLRVERQVMGTLCSIEASADGSGLDEPALRATLQAALDEVSRWDGVLSDWRPDTPLSRLNSSASEQPLAVDGDLLDWLLDARRFVEASGGAFDPTVGALVQAWGLRTQQPARPDPQALQDALSRTGLHRLVIDPAARTVARPAGLLLDPGASGKGWALDRAADVLRGRGVASALLSFRSTLVAIGPPSGREPFTVPVVHDGSGEVVTEVALRDGSLSVSGGALAAFMDGDVERGHHVDPATGIVVEAGRLAWVLAGTGAASDALGAALLVRGPSLPPVADVSGGFLSDAGATPSAWPPRP